MVRISRGALALTAVLLVLTGTAWGNDPPAYIPNALDHVPGSYSVDSPSASCPGCTDKAGHWLWHDRCPPPAYYSPFRYWTPTLARIYDCCCGPKIPVYAPDRHPEVPPSFDIKIYPCPPVLPELTIQTLPTPPETSKTK